MPPGINPVNAADAAIRAARPNFADTYRKRYAGVLKDMASVMELGIDSDKFEEVYAYPETAPYPERVQEGVAMPSKPFRYRSYTVTNVTWKMSVQWFRNAAIFDQTKSLVRQARGAGTNFANLPEEVFFQIIRQAVNDRLLRAIPNAPDGAAIYATTASGSDRFGATNGNLTTGTGVATSAAVRTDYWQAIEQFALFQDTEGQPLLPRDILDMGFKLFYNAANGEIINEAFSQVVTIDGGNNVTNVTQDANVRPLLVPTQRITDNDMFVFAEGVDLKPILEQVVLPLEEMVQNSGNSDISRIQDVDAFLYKSIRGYGVNLPYGTVKINN